MSSWVWHRPEPVILILISLGVVLHLEAGLLEIGVADEGEVLISGDLHSIRSGEDRGREWTEFPEDDPGKELVLLFSGGRSEGPSTLLLRQRDVKQPWEVTINGKRIGALERNENEMVIALRVPVGTVREGDNELRIFSRSRQTDDVQVGEIRLYPVTEDSLLNEGNVLVEVTDSETGQPLPARITILEQQGSLAPVGARSGGQLAVRPGTVYTGNGEARFGLMAGKYTVIVGRGFEYGIEERIISLKRGDQLRLKMAIYREVPTPGLVSCDTHVHTRTHSGHGDATIEERVITIAGEGLELPVATEHNLHIDYSPVAERLGVRRWFTPVIGNEVTTAVGHFNIFPVAKGAPVPDWKVKNWMEALENIRKTPGVRVVILNHPRDVHGGMRPFGPGRHLSVVAESLDGWDLGADGMELVNSGALQSDGLLLLHDWFAHLNRGQKLIAVGSSDSHDVSRHFVGQGRTYIECGDDDPGNIDVDEATSSLLAGRSMVSLGLLARLRVNGSHGPGELVPEAGEVRASVEVLGPGWTRATQVALFANGVKVREARIPRAQGDAPGVKWKGDWALPPFSHDVHLVAVATGPGVGSLHWRIPKSYQPTSRDSRTYVMGVSGVVRLDSDGDLKWSSALEYASALVEESKDDLVSLLKSLDGYDEVVAAHAANIFRKSGLDLGGEDVTNLLKTHGGEDVLRGFAKLLGELSYSESQK